ncbi:MAG: glycosyltransferase [Chitinophagaceae bacterium]|nr:glycosyltransferase [Chitinophagaceae bacterium]
MKVIHVLTHFMPDQVAGTEMYVYALQSYLQKIGFTGAVLIPDYKLNQTSEYFYRDIRVIQYPENDKPGPLIIKGLDSPEGLSLFKKLLEYERPDIVHFHEISGSNGITMNHIEAANELNIPVFLTMHLVGYICNTGTLLKNGVKKCNGSIASSTCTSCSLVAKGLPVPAANIIASLSRIINATGFKTYKINHKVMTALSFAEVISRQKERLQKLNILCDKIIVLNSWFNKMLYTNGIAQKKLVIISQALPFEYENIKPSSPALLYKGKLKIIFVGRVYKAKGLHLLLSALANIDPNFYVLDIYGPSNDIEYQNECVKIIGSNTSIQWNGIIPPGETVGVIKKYDLMCLPSTVTEMSPLVIQEAFAAGVPVLASDVYGNAEPIKHNVNGLLFRFKDISSLKEQLLRCINEPALLQELKMNIMPPRSFREVGDAYADLYNEVLFKKEKDHH